MGSPDYDPPELTPQEKKLQALQLQMSERQVKAMDEQRRIQAEQEQYLQEQDIKAAKDAMEATSRMRRTGSFGESSLVTASYGGFLTPKRRTSLIQ